MVAVKAEPAVTEPGVVREKDESCGATTLNGALVAVGVSPDALATSV